jgi:O-succinylbenzoic acid--CoA ligase
VTLISLVPTPLHDWLTTPGPIGWSGLRGVVVGGAALSPALHRRALDAGLPVLPSYGMTETGAMITLVDPAQPLSPDQGAGSVLPGCQLRIEPDGRIAVRTPGLMHGYLGDAVLATTPDRFFVTADLARLDERGNLHLHGRADGVLIAMGEKVVPEQVEAVLESVPGIRAAMVFGVPDPRRGALVCAALVGEPLSDQALLAAFAERLGAASRPRAVIWVDALPRLADGKLDRQAAPATWRDTVHRLVDR